MPCWLTLLMDHKQIHAYAGSQSTPRQSHARHPIWKRSSNSLIQQTTKITVQIMKSLISLWKQIHTVRLQQRNRVLIHSRGPACAHVRQRSNKRNNRRFSTAVPPQQDDPQAKTLYAITGQSTAALLSWWCSGFLFYQFLPATWASTTSGTTRWRKRTESRTRTQTRQQQQHSTNSNSSSARPLQRQVPLHLIRISVYCNSHLHLFDNPY